jgi:hypothetical protein
LSDATTSTREARHAGQTPKIATDSRRDTHQQVPCPTGHQQGRDTGHDDEQRALGQQLMQQPRAAGAEGHPHRDLALAAHRAGEEHVRDVRAGDQQHQRGHDDEGHKRCHEALAELGEATRERREHDAGVAPGEAGETGIEGSHGRGGLVGRHPSHDVEPKDLRLRQPRPGEVGTVRAEALRVVESGLQRERHPDVHGCLQPDAGEVARADADEGEGRAVDRQPAADDIRRPAEAPLPVGMAEDRGGFVGRAGLVWQRPAQDGRHAEHREEARRHELQPGGCRVALVVAARVDPRDAATHRRDAHAGRRGPTQRLEHRTGQARALRPGRQVRSTGHRVELVRV